MAQSDNDNLTEENTRLNSINTITTEDDQIVRCSNGYYIEANVGKEPVQVLIDTGSDLNVIQEKLFKEYYNTTPP